MQTNSVNDKPTARTTDPRAAHDVRIIRERNRADRRQTAVVTNVMERLSVYAVMTPQQQEERCREWATSIVDAVVALNRSES